VSEAAGWAPLGTTPEDIGPKAAWSPGNLPLIDNIVVAHCRRPFTGSRLVLVAMPG
jgi:Taurine catabolism dioxygenase TauD, TfdA family